MFVFKAFKRWKLSWPICKQMCSYSKVCTPNFEHFIQAIEAVTFVAAMTDRFISDDKGLSPGLLCVITSGSHEVFFFIFLRLIFN